ncbi:hypothetical protein MKZ38_007107 [Zalerion maritima]|uniref:Actin-like ATPase domain-containing protein n=1 Tax=Zalerion maritima TaxID=339359 RepID=A0AAD5RIA9_9PEZI|nr:hypothetical protein MKZ38_007107 [Zalerion maritima]
MRIHELPGSTPDFLQPYDTTTPHKETSGKFIAIGIDFGTTFSGVSWAFSETPDIINVVSQWPGKENTQADEQQVPTRIDPTTDAWGFMVDESDEPVRWFKLLLLDDLDMADNVKGCEAIQKAKDRMSKAKVSRVRLVSRFLAQLWSHAIAEIERDMGEDDVYNLPFKVGLTIPAIWPLAARRRMRDAARQAGILDERDIGPTDFILVEEPEAAAVATLFERKSNPSMVKGAVFVVCDCGGGTVDMSSYKIKSLTPFEIAESVQGDGNSPAQAKLAWQLLVSEKLTMLAPIGKLCGGFLADEAFERHMKLKAGLTFKDKDEGHFREFVQSTWESKLKRRFNGKESSEFAIRPPLRSLSVTKRIAPGKGRPDGLRLSGSHVRQFFARSLDGIQDVLKRQVDQVERSEGKKPDSILLVGGLGSSPYIFNQLKATHKGVVQPTKAWSAVARGATQKVLRHSLWEQESPPSACQSDVMHNTPGLTSRISKLSYGIIAGYRLSSLVPQFDPDLDRVHLNEDGEERVNRMDWYLKQGERVDGKKPVEISYTYFISEQSTDKRCAWTVYTSAASVPPTREDSSVKSTYTISCPIDVPLSQLPRAKKSGWRKVRNNIITMTFNGEEPKWAIRVGDSMEARSVDVEYM